MSLTNLDKVNWCFCFNRDNFLCIRLMKWSVLWHIVIVKVIIKDSFQKNAGHFPRLHWGADELSIMCVCDFCQYTVWVVRNWDGLWNDALFGLVYLASTTSLVPLSIDGLTISWEVWILFQINSTNHNKHCKTLNAPSFLLLKRRADTSLKVYILCGATASQAGKSNE